MPKRDGWRARVQRKILGKMGYDPNEYIKSDKERKKEEEKKEFQKSWSPPREQTVEELVPITEPREPTETRRRTAELANIVIKGYDQKTKLYRVLAGGKYYNLTAEQMRARAIGIAAGTRTEDMPEGPLRELQEKREIGQIAKTKLKAETLAYLEQLEANANTKELRDRYREQLERIGDVDPLVFEDLADIYSNTAILKSMAGDIPGIALGTFGGGKIGGPYGAIATTIGGVYGSWQKGTAKGAASTSGEAQALARNARMNIEKMLMNIRAGEPIGAFDDDGNPIHDPVTAFNQEWSKILYADAQLTRIYGDEYFNLEGSVGKEYQKVRSFVRDGARWQKEIAKAVIEPPMPGSPEHAAAQQAYAAGSPEAATETAAPATGGVIPGL